MTYAAPVSFGGVHPNDFRGVSAIPWFSRAAVLADSENDFKQLELYAWESQFYWGVEVEALLSMV